MEFEDCVDITQDNTKVFRIMNDFQDFLKRQSVGSNASQSNLKYMADDSKQIGFKSSFKETLSDVDAKMKLNLLEKEHLSEKQSLINSNIKLEEECSKLNNKISQLEENCDSLRLKNKHLTEQNLNMVGEVKSAKQNLSLMEVWKDKIKQFELLKEEKSMLFESVTDLELKNSELMKENLSLQYNSSTLSMRLEEALSIGELYNKKIRETALLMQEHQRTLVDLTAAKEEIHTLSSRLNDVADIEGSIQAFKEDLNRLRFLEDECKKLVHENDLLKENQENVALLNEKLLSAERKLTRAEVKGQKADQLEAANQSLLERLKSDSDRWSSDINNSLTRTEVTLLQKQLEELTERYEEVQEDRDNLQRKYVEEKRKTATLSLKVEEQSEACASLSAQLLRLKKRASLVSHERDSLRSILQSYDAELTMTSHTTQLSKRLGDAEDANQRLHGRLEQLESELQRNTEEMMRQRLLAKKTFLAPSGSKSLKSDETQTADEPTSGALEEEIARLRKKANDHEKEKEKLNERVEELEAIVDEERMKGGFDPREEKVLHFGMNPADTARHKFKQDFSELKQENVHLKKKLKELQEGRDVSVSEVEVPLAVKNELTMAELRNKRLKEVFSKKIQEFRQACYSLTGYRIDTSSDSKFKLVSMYAESETDYLLFEMMPDGAMQLLETEFSKNLGEMISLHLHHQNSIPMFLSALSVNLFSQQTMVTE